MTVRPPYRAPIPPTLAACPFLGWVRVTGQPWKPLLGADSYDECWEKLLSITIGQNNDRMVLKRGDRP